MLTSEKSLTDRLAQVLPEDVAFTFHHLSTPPTKCTPILAAPPGAKPERTYCEHQFLTVSIPSKESHNESNVFILAIEVFVYSTEILTTIFVSKADSTGYLSDLTLPRTQASPLKAIISTFVSYLVQYRQRPNKRLVVSLFARAQDQYLFPGSIENSNKHVLDDRGLVKWWCKVLDPVLREYAPEYGVPDTAWEEQEPRVKITAQGYLVVPGSDEHDTTRFFPPTVRSDPPSQKRWKHGHPLEQISMSPAAPPRSLIPHFPDDPKARFLDELDDEIPDANTLSASTPSRGNGQWKSVKTLEQFWEMMSFRQECSSGRLVGFIWVVFTPPGVADASQGTATDREPSLAPNSPLLEAVPLREARSLSKTRKLTGPILPRLPRIKSGSSNLSAMSVSEESKYYIWPEVSRGEIVLDEKDYKRAHDILLRLDFADSAVAASSTQRWIDEVAVLADRTSNWGRSVVGRKLVGRETTVRGREVNTIDLSSMRKKRKADVSDAQHEADHAAAALAAGVLLKQQALDNSLEATEREQAGFTLLENKHVKEKPKPSTDTPLAMMAASMGAVSGDLLQNPKLNLPAQSHPA
ncbi:hypothetical protein W97_08634 [Coniosporium apollinis CBS 100218]|uniref:histone acetyltransferase n=1 Tax=Coniosporium apollinis (strain CBS 100218) TaxID=1168221 RepID=R7Z5S9_CONA1|nr:uncharacterized protein W97_08634 [Coniosporium apollinis CBS 100218]EON69374.1 hypothetical protein W97_08634 [Coniosporium apollinis CBS 100218]